MNKNVRHLWLDLENTIITPVAEGWADAQMINVQKVKAFIDEFKPDHVHLFSFAIWNEWELARFNDSTKSMIERTLNIKLNTLPRVNEDIIPACCAVTGMMLSEVDFSQVNMYWGKHQAFRLFLMNYFKTIKNHDGVTVEVAFLDDDVINETFEWPDLRVRGRILNIDMVPDPDPEALDRALRSGLNNQGYSGRGVEKRIWDEVTNVNFSEP